MRDAGEELGRLLLARAGAGARIVAARSKAWMSLTFDGRHHRFGIAMPQAAIAGFRAGIEDADFPLRGAFVADIAIRAEAGLIRVEALIVADPVWNAPGAFTLALP